MLSFYDAINVAWLRKFDIDGRACRSEYWYIMLACLLVLVVNTIVAILGPIGVLLAFASQIALLWVFISASIRRLHDRDMSGAWFLVVFIPTLGFFILSIICALPGTPGFNRFGAEPLSSGFYDKLLKQAATNNQQGYQNQLNTANPNPFSTNSNPSSGSIFQDDEFTRKLRAHPHKNNDHRQ